MRVSPSLDLCPVFPFCVEIQIMEQKHGTSTSTTKFKNGGTKLQTLEPNQDLLNLANLDQTKKSKRFNQ
jgi:hypothetical protein